MWRKFRPVFGSQILATIIIASIAGWFAGVHGAISALLGGLVSISSGLVFVFLAVTSAGRKGKSAGDVIFAALKAEAAKLFLAGLLLWLVLTLYDYVVVVGLLASFVVSILIFSVALFASDKP